MVILKLWNKRPIHGEAVKWAKAAKAPFPSNRRPHSIIANGGGGGYSWAAAVQKFSAVVALVAEWILGDGWRDLVTTSSPTTSLLTISPALSLTAGIQTKFCQNWNETFTYIVNPYNVHIPFEPLPQPFSSLQIPQLECQSALCCLFCIDNSLPIKSVPIK